MGIRVDGMYGWTGDLKINICKERMSEQAMEAFRVWRWLHALAFAPLAVVKPAEGLVLGDVGVEELERVLRDHAIRDHFVVPYDVDKRQRAQSVFGVGLHGGELDFSWWTEWRLAMLPPTACLLPEAWAGPHRCPCAPPRWRWFRPGGSRWSAAGRFPVLCPSAGCVPSLCSRNPWCSCAVEDREASRLCLVRVDIRYSELQAWPDAFRVKGFRHGEGLTWRSRLAAGAF